ncbi:beta-ketoacyl synthase N-terminal-like domain-containing protein [Streptomyces sp. NPDC001774]
MRAEGPDPPTAPAQRHLRRRSRQRPRPRRHPSSHAAPPPATATCTRNSTNSCRSSPQTPRAMPADLISARLASCLELHGANYTVDAACVSSRRGRRLQRTHAHQQRPDAVLGLGPAQRPQATTGPRRVLGSVWLPRLLARPTGRL